MKYMKIQNIRFDAYFCRQIVENELMESITLNYQEILTELSTNRKTKIIILSPIEFTTLQMRHYFSNFKIRYKNKSNFE